MFDIEINYQILNIPTCKSSKIFKNILEEILQSSSIPKKRTQLYWISLILGYMYDKIKLQLT